MQELVAFLHARLDEEARPTNPGSPSIRYSGTDEAVMLPARLVVETEAKRRILRLHASTHQCPTERTWPGNSDVRQPTSHYHAMSGPCPTLRAIALAYQEHPDYRDRWL